MDDKRLIARRVARELRPGYLVKLGIGQVLRFKSLFGNRLHTDDAVLGLEEDVGVPRHQ